jgi:arsenate reductase (glutaredoxin)
MPMITIYHNPRCSKSREALTLVEHFASTKNLDIEVVDYLRTPPTSEQLTGLQKMLGIGVRDMARSNEEEYIALNLNQANDEGLLQAIASHPKLLQRPIVVYGGRAMIGRPPEILHELLKVD